MRASRLYAPTLKETPSDAEVISHQLLTRGGYIRKLTAGVYDYLPLAHRVIRNIEEIIRQELNRAGAQELLMPTVQPAEIWEESGRWQKYGPELLRLKDRKGGDFCLGPTHEEVIVDLVRRDVRSWRQLPLNLYQIQGKFRDEIRPRAGLMRGREFIMKDAYSFDINEESALQSYEAMYEAYKRIFNRCGLDFRPVEADTGSIGGSRSHEFQVLASSGEDAIVSCDSCAFAANVEQAELIVLDRQLNQEQGEIASLEKVHTPDQKSIEELSTALGVAKSDCVKTLAMVADDKALMVMVRGDHEVNEIKVKKYVGAQDIRMSTEEEIKALGLVSGFIGPYQVSPDAQKVTWLVDQALKGKTNLVVGANESDYHLSGLNLERDCPNFDTYADLRLAEAGDPCPRCGGELRDFKGIEVGHVFYLGTKYTEAMKCNVLDESGRETPIVMGCYGIGVTRVMAAAIEQNHDKDGIVWPVSLAPFKLHILTLQSNKDDVVACAENFYQEALDMGIDVLYDDRDIRAGGKFKDADLIGIPFRIAIGGRGLKEGVVEVKRRSEPTVYKVPITEVLKTITQELAGQDALSAFA